jgi:hypothetical protein
VPVLGRRAALLEIQRAAGQGRHPAAAAHFGVHDRGEGDRSAARADPVPQVGVQTLPAAAAHFGVHDGGEGDRSAARADPVPQVPVETNQ